MDITHSVVGPAALGVAGLLAEPLLVHGGGLHFADDALGIGVQGVEAVGPGDALVGEAFVSRRQALVVKKIKRRAFEAFAGGDFDNHSVVGLVDVERGFWRAAR